MLHPTSVGKVNETFLIRGWILSLARCVLDGIEVGFDRRSGPGEIRADDALKWWSCQSGQYLATGSGGVTDGIRARPGSVYQRGR